MTNSEARKRVEESSTTRFSTFGFCEVAELEVFNDAGWIGSVKISDNGFGTKHNYIISVFERPMKETRSLERAIDTANTILDGFHKAGFEVVA